MTKATLTVTGDPATRPYGSPNPPLTATFSGFVNGETVATSGVTGTPAQSNAAGVLAVPGTSASTIGLGTLASSNYTFALVPGSLTVTKAWLTVTATNKSRLYGGTVTFTNTTTGFVNNQSFATGAATGTPSFASAAPTSASGSYPIVITRGTLAANNYDFLFVDGTLTVTAAPVTVTSSVTKTYASANPDLPTIFNGLANNETAVTSGITGAAVLSTAATQADTSPAPIR